MNCDDAFDLLTRSELTDGSHEHVALEAHLAVCTECRHLAVALRPAVDLMLESWDDESTAHEQAPAPWVEAQHQAAERTSAQSATTTAGMSWTGPMGLAAAVLIGAIGAIFAMAPAIEHQPQAPVVRRVLLPSEIADLNLLGIGDTCLVHAAVRPPATKASIEAQCCTGCHAEGRNEAPPIAVATLTASCEMCHRP